MNDSALPAERWLPVPGFEGFYEVSDQGHVRSVRHMTGAGWRGGRLLKPFPDSDGYLRVNLSRHGEIFGLRPVHGLVLLAFVGPAPDGQQVRHGLGGKTDNRLVNLCYGTPLDNSDDKRRDGTMARGERQGNSRFTQADIEDMRRRHAAGETFTAIARHYETAYQVVAAIVRRKSWRHV